MSRLVLLGVVGGGASKKVDIISRAERVTRQFIVNYGSSEVRMKFFHNKKCSILEVQIVRKDR